MPELPEVETIKRDLRKKIINKKIKKVIVKNAKVVKNHKKAFVNLLEGKRVREVGRRGKMIIIRLEGESGGRNKGDEKFLLIHLKLTGKLIYQSKKKDGGNHRDKHTHVEIYFSDGSLIYFSDIRKFGFMKVVNYEELERIKSKFGIEPLTKDFKLEAFRKVIQKRKTLIKSALLDQGLIAGVGNIYADEILFGAGVRPDRKVDSLSEKEMNCLFAATNKILKKAIKYRGTSVSDYVDGEGREGRFIKFLKVYRREGQPCRRCRGKIIKIKLAGRGTRYCQNCQK